MSTPAAPQAGAIAIDTATYRRAANYIAAAAIYLQDNVLLEEPLKPEDIKPRLLGHWGTVPGINLVYAGLNRLINDTGSKFLLLTGPGHGAPANHANLWLEGSMEAVRSDLTRDRAGLTKLIRSFSWPGGFPSHLAPMVPGVIHEGGELGYALATAFGAVFDNPDLIVACIVGDGEAETGPTATAWHSPKFLDPAGSGAVLPILHVNGYKIANPTIFAAMSDQELTSLFQGYGWRPKFVTGDSDELDDLLAAALDESHAEIREIQEQARAGKPPERPAWPMIVLRSPKGWTGIKELDGQRITGTARSHQVPAAKAASNPEHLAALEAWLRSYRPEELFDDGRPREEVLALVPPAELCMGMTPHANGGTLRKPLALPDLGKHAVEVSKRGSTASALEQTGQFLADVFRLNAEERNFRIVCPDEVASNRLGAVFEATPHSFEWPLGPEDAPSHAHDGRVMEVLSEHQCQGWLQGYVLTGRHGLFPCYEAFISIVEGMVNQFAKFQKMSRDEAPWREPVSSINLLLTSIGWRQDHNGYSHQAPGFINSLLNKKEDIASIFLPPDANTMLWTMNDCLASTGRINLVIASKHPLPQWLSMEEAIAHCERGCSTWEWASSDAGDPDVVLACAGTIPTIETLAAADLLRDAADGIRVRVVNVTDLYSIAHPTTHHGGLSEEDFAETFTTDRPVVFSFHGYPSAVHQLLHHRPERDRFHVRGYAEEGTTTTPFALLAMNGVDRYSLAIEALRRADTAMSMGLPSASGAFAVRAIPDAEKIISDLERHRQELLDYIPEHGNDPEEILNWSWRPDGEVSPS
ncbi:MAG: xylulose-5-phosphate/fructose-6-phosphate phosphoketolase [Thermoleophilaceae bacterium]|nr:xylulose-5-phosphate/fructose-6-phosphate phosphoketolase [Thermoleophilaceae bacterium]